MLLLTPFLGAGDVGSGWENLDTSGFKSDLLLINYMAFVTF